MISICLILFALDCAYLNGCKLNFATNNENIDHKFDGRYPLATKLQYTKQTAIDNNMLVYLSKKIAIPNQNKVQCLSWSGDHGYIACGGEFSLLKVLKLDVFESKALTGLSTPRNLSMNQTLEGHQGNVQSVVWNDKYQKLTSSDSSGLIIVWTMFRGSWYEEMINNRNKSVVCGMAWTADGLKICIAYEDGAVIVGSVDGNRLWGKEIKMMRLSCVEWSPDGKLLIFGSPDNQVQVFDQFGNYISKVPLPAIDGVFGRNYNSSTPTTVLCIKWYKSEMHPSGLVIAFNNGLLQFMRNECDESPLIIDASMTITCIEWNSSGTILAVAGRVESESDVNKRNTVKFYDQSGELIQTLVVPGKDITSCSWEKEGLRLAIAVDCYIFFANVRPTYKWCYFASTVVFAVPATNADSENQGTVVFCETNTNTKHVKCVKNLEQMASHGPYCVFATKIEETGSRNIAPGFSSCLILCNSIGSPVDSVNLEIPVFTIAMNSNRVFAASKENFCVWKFTTPDFDYMKHNSSQNTLNSLKFGAIGDESDRTYEARDKIITIFVSKSDLIDCMTASEKSVIIAQAKGYYQVYNLPKISLSFKFTINFTSMRIELNSDSSKLAMLNKDGVLKIYDLEENQNANNAGKLLAFERKDVWDFKWSSDNTESFATAEKAKLHMFNNFEIEDSVQSFGFICAIEDLNVKTALVDALIIDSTSNEEEKSLDKYIIDIETKRLKDVKMVIEKSGLAEASKYIEQNPHQKLWLLLANSALDYLDLQTAELAFVRCKDYKGIQFTKRISKLQSDELKRAEIYAYFGKFSESERVYLAIDRKDLAIALRKLIGDWIRVVELIKSDLGASSDVDLKEALCAVGDVYVDRQQWNEAVPYYEQYESWEKLFECYTILEDYNGLKHVLKNMEVDHPLLSEIGRVFETAGICDDAVEAYLKCHKIDFAITCCVNLNEWETAIKLAEEYNVPDIDSLLHQYASHLLAKEKYLDIVELYRKANRVNDAASVLLKIVEKIKQKDDINPLLLKKIYVLIGFLYEEKSALLRENKRENLLSSLLKDDHSVNTAASLFKATDQPWKGAEAYHFYILAQRQLHDGYVDAAMKTSLHLIDYDDYIDSEDIYCLIGLASCVNHNFKLCSKAFIKLESLDSIESEKRKDYQNLAVSIFTKYPPRESKNMSKAECRYCETMIADWCVVCPNCNTKFPLCVASGRPIMDSAQQWTCKKCNHYAYKSEIMSFSNCPLCHHPIISD